MRGGFESLKTKDSKVFYNFILCFFRYQAILFTKIGADELEELRSLNMTLFNDYLSYIDTESNKTFEVNKLLHLALNLMFVAHATIADATKEV